MDGGAWWAAVHGVTKSRTWLSDFTFTFYLHALEKEMATHSSVLAWRIPGTAEPGGLPSVGSHRVGHDWSDSAAAAARVENRGFITGLPANPLALMLPVCVSTSRNSEAARGKLEKEERQADRPVEKQLLKDWKLLDQALFDWMLFPSYMPWRRTWSQMH